MKRLIVLILTVTSLGLCAQLSYGQSADFGIDVPYQEAVPAFLDASTAQTEANLDSTELQDVYDWFVLQTDRINEFLNDLIVSASGLMNNFNEEYVIPTYEALANKWNQVAATFPHFNKVEADQAALVDDLFTGLPQIGPAPAGHAHNPLAPLAQYYNDSEAVNPWELGSLWNFKLEAPESLAQTLNEDSRETTIAGVKNTELISQETIVERNGEIVYSQTIENDDVTAKFVEYRPPTLLHEVLQNAIQDGAAQDVIDYVQNFTDKINDGLELVFNDGTLDECSYLFINRQSLGATATNCIDSEGNVQSFSEMATTDPEDWVH